MKFLIILLCTLNAFAEIPQWTNDPQSACKSDQICVVGEGFSLNSANASARNEIAQFFKSRVSSSLVTYTHFEEEDFTTVDLHENFNKNITIAVDQILEGSKIEKNHKSEDGYFALASISKRASLAILKSRVKKIDKDIDSLIKSNKRVAFSKAKKFFKVRNQLVVFALLLGDKFSERTNTYKNLLKLIEEKRKLGTKVNVIVKSPLEKEQFENLIKGELSRLGYEIIDQGSGEEYKVTATVKKIKQHINVKGFMKEKFVVNMKSFNLKGSQLGAMTFDTVHSGRTIEQIFSKAWPEMKNFIVKNFDELKID